MHAPIIADRIRSWTLNEFRASLQEFHSTANGFQPLSGATYENRNPALHEQVLGLFPRVGTGGHRWGRGIAARALKAWSLVPAPRRAEICFCGAEMLVRRQGRVCPADDPGDGQSSAGNQGRCSGSHRHELLHGGRGPPAVRTDCPIGAEEQVRDVRADCLWGCAD